MAIFLSTYLPDTDDHSQQQVVAKGLANGVDVKHPFQLVEPHDITNIFRPRVPFSHKGTYGHSLIVAGSKYTMGAALLAAKACLHGGAGLTTLSIPSSGLAALNTALPEVMFLDREQLAGGMDTLSKYTTIAIGPGLGIDEEHTLELILDLKKPIVIDADALTIFAEHHRLFNKIPENSILTPHMKEFDRLFGAHRTWWDRLQTGIARAKSLNIVIVLKNERTFIIDQNGTVLINPTGNPAMAQGGMGDALTGIITAFVAQGYDAKQAALLGVYFHGKSGDELAKNANSVTATEVILQVSRAIKHHP